ncbi:RNA-directed DNA polymerase from mobile element jockey-like [Fopius arisanus]|uniref:RNA-directed DNA polymerase from mobile element jockey-like n=1 Tax=Fopius arisanus TaxID=64838 RepID=A0A9R1SYP0_9HYME|nr:PREDICTED: RNA-directed DNA polymerase from mobile element jockey-like [Fopius arisanus]
MEDKNFFCLNGRSQSDVPGKITFFASTGQSTVDYVWVNDCCLTLVEDFMVDIISTRSDHFPVSALLATSSIGSSVLASEAPVVYRVAWDYGRRVQFTESLMLSDNIKFDFGVLSIDQQSDNFKLAIIDTATKVHMIKKSGGPPASSSHPPNKPWYDADCIELKRELDSSLHNFKQVGFLREFGANYLNLKKKYANLIKLKKKLYAEELLNCLANVQSSKDFWLTIKKFRPFTTSASQISLDDWYSFYLQITPSKVPSNISFPSFTDPLLDSQVSHNELLCNILKLKNGKAAGPDEISNEFFKHLPPNWILYLETHFNKILEAERVPNSWGSAALTMIFKKGDKLDPLNYRGIALCNCLTKLFTQILRDRIQQWADREKILDESQAGFRPGRGCLDQVFVLFDAIRLQLRLGSRKVFSVFVDFRRAFDSVPHDKLWSKLLNLHLSPKIVKILKSLYDGANIRVKAGGLLSGEVPVTAGVLQGESLSPLLFILFITDLEKYLRNCGFHGVNINGRDDVLLLLYADDLVILTDSECKLQRILDALHRYCLGNGLTGNSDKTKVMVFRESGSLSPSPKFLYNNRLLEIVPL